MSITKTKKKNKDGLYQYRVRVSYQDRDGTYKQKEKAAWGLASAKEIEHSLRLEDKHSVKKIAIKTIIDEYLKVKKHEIRETSYQSTSGRIDRYITPYLGDVTIDKVTPKVLTDWKISLEQLNLSHTTKKNAFGELRAIFNFAVKMDYLQINPLLKIGNFKTGDIQESKIQVYTPQEFKRYISVAKQNAYETNYYDFYVFFNIAFFTGARKGEINALRWTNIDNNILNIKTSINQKIKGVAVIETPPKNKSSIRQIQIPKPLIDILNEHKKRQMEQPDFNEESYICGLYRPLSDTSIDVKNRAFAKTAGLHRIRIHDFRHTHASILIDNGIAITEISRRLGHSNIKETLNTYSHFFPKQEEQAVEVLNSLLI